MAIALKLLLVEENLDSVTLIAGLTFTGNYPVGGDTLDFTALAGASSPNGRIFAPSSPVIAGQISGCGGVSFGLIPGSALNNNLVIVEEAENTPESGAYGSEITGDANVVGVFEFLKQI